MTDYQPIVERLSLFNNRSFTRKQWDIVFKGCGCPVHQFFWNALKKGNIIKDAWLYRLVDLDMDAYEKAYKEYLKLTREATKKTYAKKKAQRKAREFQGLSFILLPDGTLSRNMPGDED